MKWSDLSPAADDVVLHVNVPCGPCFLQIDKLPEGRYRAAFGTLFETVEVARTRDLERLLRCTYRAMQSARDSWASCTGSRIPARCRHPAVIGALQAMRAPGGSPSATFLPS
jgi:hypothetical protein